MYESVRIREYWIAEPFEKEDVPKIVNDFVDVLFSVIVLFESYNVSFIPLKYSHCFPCYTSPAVVVHPVLLPFDGPPPT